jgi:hypothetical protein
MRKAALRKRLDQVSTSKECSCNYAAAKSHRLVRAIRGRRTFLALPCTLKMTHQADAAPALIHRRIALISWSSGFSASTRNRDSSLLPVGLIAGKEVETGTVRLVQVDRMSSGINTAAGR